MPIYSYWLSNRNQSWSQPINNNGYASISSFLINFEDLFKGANYRYKKCRLRYKMTNTTTSNAVFTFTSTLGYIGCNLASKYNYSNTLNQTAMNLMVLVDSPVTTVRLTNDTSINTAESQGVNINMPFGSQIVTISLGDSIDFVNSSNLTGALNYGYQIHLQFELYDEIK